MSGRTRILYLIDSLNYGGAERQFVRLVKDMTACPPYDPVVCSLDGRETGFSAELKTRGVEIRSIPRAKRYDFGIVLKLARLVRTERIELIHSFSVLPGLLAVLVGKALGKPVVASTIRDSKDSDRLTGLSIRMQALLADRFVSNSAAGFKCRFGKMRKHFLVVYNGISADELRSAAAGSEALMEKYHLSRFDRIVSMVASVSIYKDHDTFVDAIPEVLGQRPATGFLIVGGGSEYERIKGKVDRMGIKENVVFTGYVDHVPGLLAGTDVSVLMTNTRRIEEGISNSLLESMALGVPVVANHGGGTEEVIENGVNGLLVRAHDAGSLARAILFLLDRDDLRRKYGQAGMHIAETKFDHRRTAREYAELYRELQAGRGAQ